MVRTYKRKTTRAGWDRGNLQKALDAVSSHQYGARNASQLYHIPKSTILRHLKGRNKYASPANTYIGGQKSVMSEELEKDMMDYIVKMEEIMLGLTRRDVCDLAFQVAERNNIEHPFDRETKRAGPDWLRGFMARHPRLSLRTPEATSAARATGFNKVKVNKFFDNLDNLQQRYNFRPGNIYNVDETGITTVQGSASKIVALKGRKQIGTLTSAERGQLITVELCMSATGSFIPPMIIFPRVRMKDELMDNAPAGSIYRCHPSGWMQREIFTEWFRHFIENSGASMVNRILLILDGHATHMKNIDIIDMAVENGVSILNIPPHTSHKLQPLDVSFMKPFSTFYNQEIEVWLRSHPGRTVTQFQVAGLFHKAYAKAANIHNAESGFRSTGIYPFNRNVFSDVEFAHADMEIEATEPVEASGQPEQQDDQASSSKDHTGPDSTNHTSLVSSNHVGPDSSNHVGPESSNHVGPESSNHVGSDSNNHVGPVSSNHVGTESGKHTNVGGSYVSPFVVKPLPKRRLGLRRRRGGDTYILTDSPYKKMLMEANAKKNKPAKKQPVKRTRRKPPQSSDVQDATSSDDDTFCLFCKERYVESNSEGWIRCQRCHLWAHDACAGVDDNDDTFVCDYC